MSNKKIVISSLGNVIEWFDFGLFVFMAPLLGNTFFSAESGFDSSVNALLVFAIGFLCRPLGGIIFGYFGDTRGRPHVLKMSIFLISLSTLMLGLLPSYETAGLLSSVLFVLLRCVQGLSIGGEYSGIMIYLAESAPAHKRGFFTSFAACGANLGFLLATLCLLLLHYAIPKAALELWAWRLPFIFIGLLGSVLIYYRFKLSETQVFAQLQKKHQLEPMPFVHALKFAPISLLKIFGLTCVSATFYYVFFGFMPTYLALYNGFLFKNALMLQAFFLALMLVLVPLAGLCGDFWTRKKTLMLTSALIVFLSLPCFLWLKLGTSELTILAFAVATLLSSYDQGNSLAAVVENCPLNVRYSGIAFSYNLGMALFGGTAPVITTLLIKQVHPLAPAFYLMLMGSLSFVAAAFLLPHNRSLGPLPHLP